MRALIITAPGVQDVEFVYPYYRLQEAGYTVNVAAPVASGEKAFQGIGGLWMPCHQGLPIGKMAPEVTPDILVIPGGVKAMEKLRLEPELLKFIQAFYEGGGLISSICSGPLLLIAAGLVKGLRLTCYPAWRVDVENAGGEWIDRAAVCDDRIVTAQHYRDLGTWMSMTLTAARW